MDVNVKVKEKSQQSIGLTGGVSGISGSFIGVNYQTNNFLGRGESLEFSLTGGHPQTDFIVSFTEPYLFDTRWNMGLSVFNSRNRFDTYSVYGYTDYVTGQAERAVHAAHHRRDVESQPAPRLLLVAPGACPTPIRRSPSHDIAPGL